MGDRLGLCLADSPAVEGCRGDELEPRTALVGRRMRIACRDADGAPGLRGL